MSFFGLLTANTVDDVPKIMHWVAVNYRTSQYQQHKAIWLALADMLDRCAHEAHQMVTDMKAAEPKSAKRVRLKD